MASWASVETGLAVYASASIPLEYRARSSPQPFHLRVLPEWHQALRPQLRLRLPTGAYRLSECFGYRAVADWGLSE
jgi:hypothetical protein